MEEEETGMEQLDFDLVPTVRVGVDSGAFSAEVIELYELPFEKVMHALNVPNGPAQMMAMLEIFKLAIMDQSKLSGLDVLSFNELADLLGQWAMLSTPPSVSSSEDSPRKLVKKISLDVDGDDPEVSEMIEKVLNPETSFEELMEIAQHLASKDSDSDEEVNPPRKRGRHAKLEDDEDELF